MQLLQSFYLKPKNILDTTKKKRKEINNKSKKKALQVVASSPPAVPSGTPLGLAMSSSRAFSWSSSLHDKKKIYIYIYKEKTQNKTYFLLLS